MQNLIILKILIFMQVMLKNYWPNVLKTTNTTPSVVFVDPPRKGLDKTTIETIKKHKT